MLTSLGVADSAIEVACLHPLEHLDDAIDALVDDERDRQLRPVLPIVTMLHVEPAVRLHKRGQFDIETMVRQHHRAGRIEPLLPVGTRCVCHIEKVANPPASPDRAVERPRIITWDAMSLCGDTVVREADVLTIGEKARNDLPK